jgi:hypothetical protein
VLARPVRPRGLTTARMAKRLQLWALPNGTRLAPKGKYLHCVAYQDHRRGQSTRVCRNYSSCTKATFLLRRHHSVRVSGETWVYAYRKEQGSLNDVDQERYSDSPEVGFCIATGEAGHIKCRAGSGLWSLLRIRWRSKKLDKTSRLVRINHRIFRSLRARERFSSVKCNPGRPQVSHFCKIWFWK